MICTRTCTRSRSLLLALLSLLPGTAHASGPRWVTGQPYYSPEGVAIVWYTSSPRYFTDPGDLSPYVSHSAADAIVNAAAAVWTVPTANLNLLYGGTLAQHASSDNVYAASTGIVFPSDTKSTNYLNIQIAVLYDSDGSIIDLMLGNGASSPSSCRQNAVLESVDAISTAGKIQHAILVLNGRCTGPAPEQQLQLQYQLMRAFGRVLGLSWSQTNDNVFTGTPTPTIQQALHWPIMHPIDVICGPYTYQCTPQPFTLRDDDVSGLCLLYPVGIGAPSVPGKTNTLTRATRMSGTITFPNGQGMQGVNVVVHRLEPSWNTPEAWEDTSAVSGARFRRRSSTPLNKVTSSPSANMGSPSATYEGYYDIFRTPLAYDWEPWQNLILSTQSINPLYIGPYAVGPYDTNVVVPSGSSLQQTYYVASAGWAGMNFSISNAAPACLTTQDGTESATALIPFTGWWTGNLCSYNHTAWSLLPVKASRSFTIEVTALDESSLATPSKMMPVIGLWNATDATGTLPSIAATPSAFNTSSTGMTAISAQTSQPQSLRIAILDQRGDGRPDFAYKARVLYADSVTPSTVPAKGAPITVTGIGFRPGNTVSINGISASVSSWTSTAITAVAPLLHNTRPIAATVTVQDLSTGGSTTMTGALNYQAAQPELTLLSAPSGIVIARAPAAAPFAVKAISGDGVTPLANVSITLSATSGQVRFEACGQPTCTLTTDSSGTVTSAVTPLIPGLVTLSAISSIGDITAGFIVLPRIQTITVVLPQLYLAQSSVLTWNPQVTLTDNAVSTAGLPVQWTPLSGHITLTPPISSTNQQSLAQATATAGPLAADSQATASACAWNDSPPSTCAMFSISGIGDSALQLRTASGDQQSIDAASAFAPVVLLVTDSTGHPVAGATVSVRQTLSPWSPPCPPQGRCPIAPVYGSSSTTLISGLDGTVSVTALEPAASPELIQAAATTGTSGFTAFHLQKTP
jgi:hypothetical protein